MIYDNLDNAKQYENSYPLFKIAFDFLKNCKGKEIGRYDLEKGVFALVQGYNTKNEKDCKWETHKNYIDLQYVFKGKEDFGVAEEKDLKVSIPYNKEKDVSFFNGEGTILKMQNNQFVVVFPWDAHKPQMGDGSFVEKIVIKIPYANNL